MRSGDMFDALSQQLREMKGAGLIPPEATRHTRFRTAASRILTPVIQNLAQTLQNHGVKSELQVDTDEVCAIALHLPEWEASIRLSADADPRILCLSIARGPAGQITRERRLPYSRLDADSLADDLTQIVLHALVESSDQP